MPKKTQKKTVGKNKSGFAEEESHAKGQSWARQGRLQRRKERCRKKDQSEKKGPGLLSFSWRDGSSSLVAGVFFSGSLLGGRSSSSSSPSPSHFLSFLVAFPPASFRNDSPFFSSPFSREAPLGRTRRRNALSSSGKFELSIFLFGGLLINFGKLTIRNHFLLLRRRLRPND